MLGACTDEANIALRVLQLNEELELRSRPKMYAKALEVRSRAPAVAELQYTSVSHLPGTLCSIGGACNS